MNHQKRRQVIKPKTNIRVIREGNVRLSDRRPPAQWLSEEQPKPKIHPSSVSVQNSTNGHSYKMPSSVHYSFHSANEADRLLDLSATSSSSLSVKSCFGSFGTLNVKLPASRLREVQNLPEDLEIPINSTSTPLSLSPECGTKTKQVFAEKHSPGKKSLYSSTSSIDTDVKNANPNGLWNKTEGNEFDPSDMFLASAKNKPPEIITVSEPISQNSSKSDVIISDSVGEPDGSEASRKTVSDQKPRPIRVHQGSAATGKMFMQKKIPNNNNNVQITNFSASDSLAARKALLTKKTQNATVPVRRTVPAKAIISTNQSDNSEEKKDVCHSCHEKSLLPDAVSAVAAATAAALTTQPLISSQNKLESQLSMLLEKINSLEHEAALKQKELENEGKTQKIAKLETHLNQVTDERMKHLEQLQKQLFGMQTKFLSVARSFEKMSGTDMVKHLQPETQKPPQTQDVKDTYLNASSNSSIGLEMQNNPSMSSGYQTLPAPLDQQNSITEDKASQRSFGCEDMDSQSDDFEKICSTKDFNINNSGKLNMNSVGHHHTAKNIYAPFLEKKPKVQDRKVPFSGNPRVQDHKVPISGKPRVQDHKVPLSGKPKVQDHKVPFSGKPRVQDNKLPFSGQTRASSMVSKSKENVQQKPDTVKEASKNIAQKKTSSLKNKVGSQPQRVNKGVGIKPSKEKQGRSDVKRASETQQPPSVPVNTRYSVLKDFVSGGYSQQPYVIRETEDIPKSAPERILNASYTVEGDASKEQFSQVVSNRPESNKEAPLEKYLLQSPDKSLLFTQDKIYSGQPSSFPSAEVLAGQEILRKAQTSRMVLEANLQKVERDHEKDAVYGLVDNLYEGSPARHRLQLRRKVDQCIAKVQKDIRNELSQAESSKHSPPNKTKSQKSARSLNDRKAPADKLANKKVLVTKDQCRDSDYLAKVFGKAAYENKRTTVKNPYPRFQNQPKPKSPRAKETVPVKGIQMRSAKTQTPQEKEEILKPKPSDQLLGPMYIDNKKYFFASAATEHLSSVNLQHGHLGFMAVALREPRMDSGLKVPVAIRAGESLTMAPEDQPKIVPASNVMLCNIPVYNEEHVTKKRPALVKQTLPCVVIEAQQETSRPCKNFTTDSKPSAEETEKKTSLHNIVISDEDSDEEVDARSELSESDASSEQDEKEESLIILSGSKAPILTGGKTWKPVAELIEKTSEEDILDSLHNRDFIPLVPLVPEADKRNYLQDEALQWVEQEILSQILSNHSNQPPLPSSDFVYEEDDVPQNNATNYENEEPVPSGLQTSTVPSPFIDKVLISQLVEELLVDKVNDMLKEALAENIYSPIISDPASPQNESKSESGSEKLVPSEPVLSPRTPELTPVESEESLASPLPDVPLPQTPSASPEPVLEKKPPIAEASLPNESPEEKLKRTLFHETLIQEINKLREEESFTVTHTEDGAVAVALDLKTVVTPERTPSLTSVLDGFPITPVGSPSVQPEVLEENNEVHVRIRTPSPSTFSPDSAEEAADIRQGELPLTNTQDNISPIKEATEDVTSVKDVQVAAVEATHSMKPLESASPEETDSVSSTASESGTIFESLSVGQWLLSKSEGQAADFGIGEKAYQQILNDASMASTLRDTEDLFQDETTEMTYSEGEVVYKSRVPPEKDPILELVSQMQNRNPLILPADFLLQSNGDEKSAICRSLGEFPLIRSELNLPMNPQRKSPTDPSLEPKGKPLKLQQSELAQAISLHSDPEDENLSEKEICPPQKGARIIEVGKRVPQPMEPVSSIAEPTKWKGIPSRIEVGSISDSDQTNFMQKSVRFSEDGRWSSVDYAAYLESSSDLVASDMEKLSTRSSRESVPSQGDIFQEVPEQRRRMSVTIPLPDIFDDEDIEEISLGEEK